MNFTNIIVIRVNVSPEHLEFVLTKNMNDKHPGLFNLQPNPSPSFSDIDKSKWTKFRINVYDKFTKVCLENQSKKPDQIFLLFETGDKPLVEQYLNIDSDLYTIVYKDGVSDCGARDVFTWLQKKNITSNIALTRIDSDDFISRDFLDASNNTYINYCKTNTKENNKRYRVWPKESYITDFKQLRKTNATYGPPIWTEYIDTLVEPIDLYEIDHNDLWRDPDQIKLFCENGAFMQLVHDWNSAINAFWDLPKSIVDHVGLEDKEELNIEKINQLFEIRDFEIPRP